MERWCQQINVHYFCFETALFGKIFGHMCKEKICVPPPPSGGWLRRKNCMPFPGIFFPPPPPLNSAPSGAGTDDSQWVRSCVELPEYARGWVPVFSIAFNHAVHYDAGVYVLL